MKVSSIYYDDNTNSFEDEDGSIIYDLSKIISPNKLLNYKEVGGTYYFPSDNPNVRWEVVFPIREDTCLIYYDVEENTMTDEEENIIYNIFSFITPNDLLLFKRNKKDVYIPGLKGGMVNMIYVDRRERKTWIWD